MTYKRFIVYAFDCYYPSGFLGDIVDSFDSLEEAITAAKKTRYDYQGVFDCDERQQVWSN